MNNLIKLPLFLGITACLCGGALALTNYFTKDKIEEGKRQRENAAYLVHFSDMAYKSVKENEDSSSSKTSYYEKMYCYDASKNYIGTIYSCNVTGFADKINFTVSFKNGNYNNFVNISNKETSAGSKYMIAVDEYKGDLIADLDSIKTSTGSSVTSGAVSTAVTACYNDYLAEYQTSAVDYVEEAK